MGECFDRIRLIPNRRVHCQSQPDPDQESALTESALSITEHINIGAMEEERNNTENKKDASPGRPLGFKGNCRKYWQRFLKRLGIDHHYPKSSKIATKEERDFDEEIRHIVVAPAPCSSRQIEFKKFEEEEIEETNSVKSSFEEEAEFVKMAVRTKIYAARDMLQAIAEERNTLNLKKDPRSLEQVTPNAPRTKQ
ncbi:uncharacterized protein LOC141562215 isoform X2 [Sminthopsis crassicaudata]|uniref:uncharacterized protein LOC141562215 isoform X2 n=1 Tax=Sminthopsis crassicaudata TaxID=9301 RepID=UPI003D69E520